MIYFLRSPSGPIKIGTTIRLSERLKALSSEYGPGLEVMAVIEGSYPVERELHRQFGHLRTVGEWFEPGDDLIGFIVSDGKPWDGQDEIPAKPGSTIRVSEQLAEALNAIAGVEKISIATLLDNLVLETAIQQAAEATAKAAKRWGN